LEGKTTDENSSSVGSSSKQPEFGIPLIFMKTKIYVQQQTKANQPIRHLKV